MSDRAELLARLNTLLRQHPEFEEGMAFTEIQPGGYVLFDPRLLEYQRGEREDAPSFAPFIDALAALRTEGSA